MDIDDYHPLKADNDDDDGGGDMGTYGRRLSSLSDGDKLSIDSDFVLPKRSAKSLIKRYKSLSSDMANFSIQYNFNSITLALVFVEKTVTGDPPYYHIEGYQESLLKSLVFVGAVLGQLTMGYLGDCWGRQNAMIFTNALVVFGALGSALLSFGDVTAFVNVCCVARLIIGVGIGGNYPLAATMSSEAATEGAEAGDKSKAGFKVAGSFFWQLPGLLSVYLVGLILTAIFGADAVGMEYRGQTAFSFRFILALGAVPSLVVVCLLARIRCEERRIAAAQRPMHEEIASSGATNPEAASTQKAGQNLCKIICQNPAFFTYLIATGGCWFLYDFVFYGSVLNTPTILDGVFGTNNTVQATCWQTFVVDLAAFPGVIAGIFSLKGITAKQLQSWGFFSMAVVFLIVAAVFLPFVDIEHDDTGKWFAFALLCLMLMVLNFGAGLSTYVLPTTTYPKNIRSTFFGFSAACGKIGAVVGTAVFSPIFSCCSVDDLGNISTAVTGNLSVGSTISPNAGSSNTYGPTVTFVICAVVCTAAIILTHFFIDPRRDSTFCESREQKLKPQGLGSLN